MEIIISGSRSSSADWHAAHHAPADVLPALTDEQKEVAKKFGVSEDGYARSAYADDLTRKTLRERALRLGKWIESKTLSKFGDAHVQQIWLKTFEGKYRVDLKVDGQSVMVFLKEELVDDLFDYGLSEAEEKLKRILEQAIATQKAVI